MSVNRTTPKTYEYTFNYSSDPNQNIHDLVGRIKQIPEKSREEIEREIKESDYKNDLPEDSK